MIKLIVKVWREIKRFSNLASQSIDNLNENLAEATTNLDQLNRQSEIKLVLSQVERWRSLIELSKTTESQGYVNTTLFFEESLIFCTNSQKILKEMLKSQSMHNDFSQLLKEFKVGYKRFMCSREYKNFIKNCNEKGLNEYHSIYIFLTLYFKQMSFPDIEKDATSLLSFLNEIKLANSKMAILRASLNI